MRLTQSFLAIVAVGLVLSDTNVASAGRLWWGSNDNNCCNEEDDHHCCFSCKAPPRGRILNTFAVQMNRRPVTDLTDEDLDNLFKNRREADSTNLKTAVDKCQSKIDVVESQLEKIAQQIAQLAKDVKKARQGLK